MEEEQEKQFKRISINLDEEAQDMLDIISKERGIKTVTDMIRYAIFETAKSLTLPDYLKEIWKKNKAEL